jgi:hypothetical protein
MQKNILNSPDISKIYLKFNDGKKNPRNELVKIRYVDKKSVYFAGQSIINFSKPGWRAKCEIVIYTPDGIYITNVIIQETIFSFQDLFF